MRVLVVTNLYPPDVRGGYERMCAEAASRWARGHDITVLTQAGAAPPRETDRAGVRVRRVLRPRPGDRRHGGRLIDARWHAASALATRSVLREARPDLVVTYGTYGLSAAVLASVFAANSAAVVMDYCLLEALTAPAPEPAADRLGRGWAGAMRLATAWTGAWRPLPRPRRWVFVSQAIRATYEAALGPLDATVVYNGVSVPNGPLPLPDRSDRLRVGGLGRLVPEKGWHTLVAAAALLAAGGAADAAEIEIRGPVIDPAYAARLRSEAAAVQRRGVPVSIGEPLAGGEVAEWLAGKDCVVVPSEWAEPFALVPLEAMALGRPVVGTVCGGAAELLEDGVTALVHEPGDAAGLAAALRRLAGDPALGARLAAAGHARVLRQCRREVTEPALDMAVLGDGNA